MTVERVLIESNAVLRVSGRMDVESVSQFEAQCERCIADGYKAVVVDMGDVSYISSMGLRAFVSEAKKLKDAGGTLQVCRLTGLVRQVFEITRLTQVFPMHESVETALLEVSGALSDSRGDGEGPSHKRHNF